MTIIKDIKNIIENSGNNFHIDVIEFLKNNGWTTQISTYYHDNSTGKPREIDLIAEKFYKFEENKFKTSKYHGLIVKLFIECKYFPQNIAFWFFDKDQVNAQKLVITETYLTKNNTYTEQHHYLTEPKVAKLYDSAKDNPDNELIYKAINQSLNAMLSFKNSTTTLELEHNYKTYTVNYPVIACNSFDKFYRVDTGNNNEPVEIKDNFQLEINYAYYDASKKSQNKYFLVDIVAFDKFSAFLDKTLNQDIEALKQLNYN